MWAGLIKDRYVGDNSVRMSSKTTAATESSSKKAGTIQSRRSVMLACEVMFTVVCLMGFETCRYASELLWSTRDNCCDVLVDEAGGERRGADNDGGLDAWGVGDEYDVRRGHEQRDRFDGLL